MEGGERMWFYLQLALPVVLFSFIFHVNEVEKLKVGGFVRGVEEEERKDREGGGGREKGRGGGREVDPVDS